MFASFLPFLVSYSVFFFNDTATTEIYTLSLHDALPIFERLVWPRFVSLGRGIRRCFVKRPALRPKRSSATCARSEEHTSELQSLAYLVCRLLLEKKKHILLEPRRPHHQRITLPSYQPHV